MKAGITSSRYGLYKLGYTFATMKITVVGREKTRLEINCRPAERRVAVVRSDDAAADVDGERGGRIDGACDQ